MAETNVIAFPIENARHYTGWAENDDGSPKPETQHWISVDRALQAARQQVKLLARLEKTALLRMHIADGHLKPGAPLKKWQQREYGVETVTVDMFEPKIAPAGAA